ncbi:MAG: DUF4124 domain-containing protein [Casimicrobiaceae bacterium]
MLTRLLPFALALLAGVPGLPAHADVYKWVDESGRTNVSNLPPPAGAQIVSVAPTIPKSAAQVESDREAARRAEMLALNDRVSRLQEELEQSRRQAPPMAYMPTPPPPQYSNWAPPAAPYYDETPAQMSTTDCGWPYNHCGGGWGYPPAIVVIGGSDFRRGNPHRGDRPGHTRPPGRPRPKGVAHRS